jgi:hypothetical protein
LNNLWIWQTIPTHPVNKRHPHHSHHPHNLSSHEPPIRIRARACGDKAIDPADCEEMARVDRFPHDGIGLHHRRSHDRAETEDGHDRKAAVLDISDNRSSHRGSLCLRHRNVVLVATLSLDLAEHRLRCPDVAAHQLVG